MPINKPNLFAKDHHQRVTQWQFMQSFMPEIARLISPNDEHLDYIPTQAVAEFLANHLEFHLGGKRHRIEAIIFRSAQYPGGKNIVLLGNAGHVEHTVDIQINPSKPRRLIAFPHSDGDRPRLRVVADSVSLHSIDGAVFTSGCTEITFRLTIATIFDRGEGPTRPPRTPYAMEGQLMV